MSENNNTQPAALASVVDLALEAGKKHREKVLALRKALEAGDKDRALDLAREVCGLKRKADAA